MQHSKDGIVIQHILIRLLHEVQHQLIYMLNGNVIHDMKM